MIGIGFQPNLHNAREFFFKQPAPAIRPPVTLNWAPIYGDIALTGDLGYTTGPFLLTDNSAEKRPARHGMYFSIWQKQTDGNWKVVLDIGVETPEAVAPLDAPFVAAQSQSLRRSLDRHYSKPRQVKPATQRTPASIDQR